MSYLPRMSKTYKEPQPILLEEEPVEDDLSFNTLKPASSLLAEGTHNPQMALKHYRFIPHPPPVLPGPSVLEEAIENELSREASRHKRSLSKVENSDWSTDTLSVVPSMEETPKAEKSVEIKQPLKRSVSRKSIKRSKSGLSRKKSSRSSLDKKKEQHETKNEVAINMCLVGSDIAKSFVAAQTERKSRNATESDTEFLNKNDLNALKREVSLINVSSQDVSAQNQKSSNTQSSRTEEKSEEKSKKFTNRSVQCTIFGNAEKIFVIPPVINSLVRALAFLLHELNREEAITSSSGERRSLLNQIQLSLGDLCNQKVQKEFGFDTTYSDSKRLERILGDLQKYMKKVYGDKGEYIDRMEDLKRVFLDLKKKEMELNILKDKLIEKEELEKTELVFKESFFKNPEITLQNKRLESEQLLAEVEFSSRELRNCQKTLAEIDWEIKNNQDQMISLKKTLASKSKSEILGRKSSTHKFSSLPLARGSKSKENENCIKKKI